MVKKNIKAKPVAPKKRISKEVEKKKQVRKAQIQLVLGGVFIAFSMFLLFAFVSFLFHAEADQSKLQLNWFKLVGDSSIKVENITGKSGAWLANVFINEGFGVSSFLFVYLFVIYGLKLWKRKISRVLVQTIKVLIAIIWLSVTLGFVFGYMYPKLSVYPGGQYGYHLSLWLKSVIGNVGVFFLLIVALFTYVIFAFEGTVNLFKRKERIKVDPEGELIDGKSKTKKQKEERVELIDENEIEPDPIGFDVEEILGEDTPLPSNIKIERISEPEDELEETEPVDEQDEDGPEMIVEKKEVGELELENEPLEDYDPTLDLSHYKYPTIDLLDDYSHLKSEVTNDELIENKNKIVETLGHFKIEIIKIKATIGPTVTLYEIVPKQGIRISKIKNLEDDIALSLAALGIRIIAPIPGRGTIGIEVPNRKPQMVSMRSIIASKKFQESTAELPVAMGRTISNETFVFDLAKMPHLLVAGATGQGKSVGLNAIITSLLYKKHPSQLKFVFVDPKKVELNLYSVIEKHFLAKMPDVEEPIITDVEKVKATLNSVGHEMDNRYDLLKLAHTRNLKEYNKKFIERRLNPEKGHRFLPYIVVVVDEFADLIMTAGKEVELPIARIAQLARAVGIHMIIATQRPSANIITGIIKANFPSRIAFKVASAIDSRTILDQSGANQLIGKGDMLFSQGSELVRLQCAFVDTPEVEGICQFIADQQGYASAFLLPEFSGEEGEGIGAVDLNQRDEFFEDAARLIVLNQQGSTSMIQRKFSIGYNRAGRIMDQLEAAGIVGQSEGSKTRKVFYSDEYSLEQLLTSLP